MAEALQDLATLSGSDHRMAILRTLEEDSRDVATLRDELDIPRATVRHNLTRLSERGMVERARGEYRLTTFGRRIRGHVDDCLATMSTVRNLAPFLDLLPPDVFQYDLSRLDGARVTTAEPSAPHAPMERLVDCIADTDHIRMLVPVTAPPLVEACYREVVEKGHQLEIIVQETVLSRLHERFGQQCAEGFETGRYRIGKYGATVPFALALLDDRVALGGHDDQNVLRCLVDHDSPGAVQLGEEIYAEYEAQVDCFHESPGRRA